MTVRTNVSPTPIQRNVNDVATELTLFYCRNNQVKGLEEIQKAYADFYAVANAMHRSRGKILTELLPENIKKI